MGSIFTKIIKGQIPSYKIHENDDFYAFLDINPNAKGHTLVIPKKEENKLFDLDENSYISLMKYAYKIAKAVEKSIPCERVGMTVIGLEVPHVHIHLIPLHSMADATFSKKEKLNSDEFKKIAKEISRYL